MILYKEKIEKGDNPMQTELELQLHRELETLEETNDQYTRTERRLDQLEDDALWRNSLGFRK